MPSYVYFCKECEENFEVKHSFTETTTICEICGYKDALVRRPSAIILVKKAEELAGISGVGEVIKATIEETRQDIATEKEKLQNRVYKK